MGTLTSEEVRKSAEIFRERLSYLIKEKGLRMIDMPTEIGIPRGTVARYLTGERTPDYPHLLALAVYFRVSIDWLTGINDNISLDKDEKLLLDLYKKAADTDKEVIGVILKKYIN